MNKTKPKRLFDGSPRFEKLSTTMKHYPIPTTVLIASSSVFSSFFPLGNKLEGGEKLNEK
jgi:hypothetical protein